MWKQLVAMRAIDAASQSDAVSAHEPHLKRVLTARHLIALGIGAVVGAGIFIVTGQAAAAHAGPALVLSFLIAGLACGLSALCYAEFAAMIPVSGGAYAYAYATLGELVAWFIGWCLILEYLFAVASVAAGWSGYFNACLNLVGHALHLPLNLPPMLADAPFKFDSEHGFHIIATGALINLPAIGIIALLATFCYLGISQSSFVNNAIVSLKLGVIVLFLVFACRHIDPANWHPFIPASQGQGKFGVSGIFRGAVLAFFSYIGFDAVSSAAGEARHPQRDLPIGILGSLAICTVLYIAMALTLTGIAPYRLLGTPDPVATALSLHPSLAWLQAIVAFGALAGLSSVILVMSLGTSRLFFSMARDGLLPKSMGKVHGKHHTPHVATIVGGVFAAVMAGLFPIGALGELVSMGTLLAFTAVCIGVLVLRRTRPDLPRGFRVPLVWPVGISGALICLYLFWQSFRANWPLMLGWITIGALLYAGYGYRHSRLHR